MITKDDIVEIGKFMKTHALKGELNALLDVDFDYADDGNPLIVEIDGIFVPFYAESLRPKGTDAALIKLHDVDSQDAAREFVNKIIYGLRKDVADYFEVSEDEIASDFKGFKIVDNHIGDVGTVIGIDDSTANILFIVERADGSEVLVPVADEFIESVDEPNKVIKTTLPSGLLDI